MPNLKLVINGQYFNNRGDEITLVSCEVDTKTGGMVYTCDSGIQYAPNGRALAPATFGDSLVAPRYSRLRRPPRK